MDTKTQRRGPADTTSSRFAWLLVVSLLLHVPFTPWAALVGLLRVWSPPADDVSSPPITAIPVDLIEDQVPAAPSEPAPADTTPDTAGPVEPAVSKPKPKPAPTLAKLHDAGAPDAGEPDAEAADAGEPDAGPAAADAGPKRADAGAGLAAADAGAVTVDRARARLRISAVARGDLTEPP